MPKSLISLSEKDVSLLLEVLRQQRAQQRNTPNRPAIVPIAVGDSPSGYEALTPSSGIPGLTPSYGTGTGTGTGPFTDAQPGTAQCALFQLCRDFDRSFLDFTGEYAPVYNLSKTAIPGRAYIPIFQDRTGNWITGLGSALQAPSGGGSPTGPAGGDLSGTYPNPTVAALEGLPVSAAAPTVGQALVWDGSKWSPGSPAGSLSANQWYGPYVWDFAESTFSVNGTTASKTFAGVLPARAAINGAFAIPTAAFAGVTGPAQFSAGLVSALAGTSPAAWINNYQVSGITPGNGTYQVANGTITFSGGTGYLVGTLTGGDLTLRMTAGSVFATLGVPHLTAGHIDFYIKYGVVEAAA